MAETSRTVRPQVLPLVEHLVRVGRRTAEGLTAVGGLRPRHLIALKLLSEQGPSGQQGLTHGLSLDPSNVVGLLNELEGRGLVTRRRDPADRRRHIVEISPLGEEELHNAYDQLGLIEDRLFSVLSTDERLALHEMLTRVLAGEPPYHPPAEDTDHSDCQD
ncbi:MarR family winged helix-turn-helix transcriptional regulator [Streptomyces sp. NPDC026672]|uniref:MarR family winged helix-turn-helix transcriptional regulator n=1 Tax=unclassified Streptomyces TaxID=2593676 RepID=UPI003410DAB9